MKTLGWIYVCLIVVFALYGTWWGDQAYRGFAYNLGAALVWPAILFPSIGKVISGIVIIAFVAALTLKKK